MNKLHHNIYRMIKPCDDCPFIDRHKLHISAGRLSQIKEDLDKGGSFNCHKTVYPEEFGIKPIDQINLKMCYGAYAYLKETDNPNTQMKFAKHLNIKEEPLL